MGTCDSPWRFSAAHPRPQIGPDPPNRRPVVLAFAPGLHSPLEHLQHPADMPTRTAFQPIMSDRGHVVAYEALLCFREGLDKPESRARSLISVGKTG